MISFAGIELPAPSEAICSWARRNLSYEWPAGPAGGPGRRLPRGPVEIGLFRYPCWGAGVWGSAFFIVDDAALAPVRDAVYLGGQPAPQDLVMDDGVSSLTAPLWMLPASPLQQTAEANGLYLLSLVDDRYFWPGLAADVVVTPGETTWEDLFDALAEAVSTPIEVDPVPAEYLAPPADLATAPGGLPGVLDAACASVGMRLVRSLAGDLRVMSAGSSQGKAAANLAAVTNPAIAGGTYLFGGGQ